MEGPVGEEDENICAESLSAIDRGDGIPCDEVDHETDPVDLVRPPGQWPLTIARAINNILIIISVDLVLENCHDDRS